MFGFFYTELVGALMLVTSIRFAHSFANSDDWKRELHSSRDINIYINGNAHPTRAESNTETPPKHNAGAAILDEKFIMHLVVRVDAVTGQASLPETITTSGVFGRKGHQDAKHCEGRRCNYSLEFEIVDPTVTPAFTELQKVNTVQINRTADGRDKNYKRVTTVPRHLKPFENQVLNNTLTSKTTVQLPMPSEKQIVNRTRTANGEWARRIQAPMVNVRTTTARNPVPVDSNEDVLLLESRYDKATYQSRAEVSRRTNRTWTMNDTDILFQEKKNERNLNDNRKRQTPGHGAKLSDKDDGEGQSSELNQSIFRNPGKLLTVFPEGVPSQTTGILAGHPGGQGAIFNPVQNHSSTEVPYELQVNQTNDDWTALETSNPTVLCEQLHCLPWERRANFEVQINPKTGEIINIRVHTTSANSKTVIQPSEEYKDSRNTKEPSLPPSSASGTSEEILWQSRAGHEINPKTDQVVNIRNEQNTTNKPIVRTYEKHEDYTAGKSATQASETVLEPTVIHMKDDELPWLDRRDYQVQIDPKTKQVVNIRTQTRVKPRFRPHEHQEDSIAETTARQALPTQMVAEMAPLPIPFYYRKQIFSPSSYSDSFSSNLRRDDVLSEIKTVIPVRSETITEPSKDPKQLPWQQKDGFEVQVSPVTKEIVNIRMQAVANARSIPIPVHGEQPTLPNSVRNSATLISETTGNSGDSLRKLEDDHEVQTNARTIATRIIPSKSRINLPRKEVAKITVPSISRNDGGQTKITAVPTAELPKESTDFPWEQRDDYEIQIDPKTKQVVNIRLLTTTTHNPTSKSTQLDDTNDHVEDFDTSDDSIVRSRTSDRIRTVDISKIVKLDDERHDFSVEHSGSIFDQNSKIQTQLVPRRKEVGEKLVKHTVRIGDDLPGEPKSSIAVLPGLNPKNSATRTAINGRPRPTKTRKPIFSHSDADGVLYFRYADNDDLWEELEIEQFNGDAKFVLVDEDDWIPPRRGRGRNSPYFYYSQNNSSIAMINFSCYILLLITCLVSFIL